MHKIWLGMELAGGTVTRISRKGLTITVDGQPKTITLSEAERLI